MNGNCGNESLLVACIEWLKAELVRTKYCVENAVDVRVPARFKQTFMVWAGYDDEKPCALCDGAIRAVRSGDFGLAKGLLEELQDIMRTPMSKITGGDKYNSYLNRLIEVFDTDLQSVSCREVLAGVWFEMVHGWRGEGGVGDRLSSIYPDALKFSVLGWIATVFGVGIGIVLPIVKCSLSGVFLLWVFLVFGFIFGGIAGSAFIKNTTFRLAFQVVFAFGTVTVARWFTGVSGEWILWAWGGGALIGYFICLHLVYARCRRLATKYGPFACLWARHIKGGIYELLLIKTDGSLAWHYVVERWNKNVDPVLCGNLSMGFRMTLRQLGFESQPNGGWFPCYVGLVSPRMVGVQQKNPADWAEARRTTLGLTDDMIDRFFTNTPSPLAPPQEFQNSPAVKLPTRVCVSW